MATTRMENGKRVFSDTESDQDDDGR
jgi:hypothetical protein